MLANVEIIQYEPSHVEKIMEENPRSYESFWCQYEDWGKWIHQWKEYGPSYTLFIDSKIIMCAGVMIPRKGFGEAWMVLSTLFNDHIKECFRIVRDKLEEIIKDNNLKRIQSLVITGFPEAEHWLIHLGFENETPTKRGMKSFFENRDMYLYAREIK